MCAKSFKEDPAKYIEIVNKELEESLLEGQEGLEEEDDTSMEILEHGEMDPQS